jgi:hypothetical protein
LNLQYYITPKIGFQVEYFKQYCDFYSHLEWSKIQLYDPETFSVSEYLIDYVEEPYKQLFCMSSITISFVYAEREYIGQKLYPYVSIGTGLYFFSGDKEKVMNRVRFGPKTKHSGTTACAGLKYFLSSSSPRFGFNCRFYTAVINLGNQTAMESGHNYPFSAKKYLEEGKILRISRFTDKTNYLGLEISLELAF